MTTAISTILPAVDADDWQVVRYGASSFRVVRQPGPHSQYHRGSDGAVRVYRDEQAARRRAEILNGKVVPA